MVGQDLYADTQSYIPGHPYAVLLLLVQTERLQRNSTHCYFQNESSSTEENYMLKPEKFWNLLSVLAVYLGVYICEQRNVAKSPGQNL